MFAPVTGQASRFETISKLVKHVQQAADTVTEELHISNQ